MAKTRETLVTVVSDLHCGSTLGLCPPVVPLPDGGSYRASRVQEWLWQCWLAFWDEARERGRRRRRVMVVNGDIVEGIHHRTAEIIAPNRGLHVSVAEDVLGAAIEMYRPHAVLFVRGTTAHVGEQGWMEERLAAGFARHVPHDQPYSRYVIYTDINGVLIHFTHHVQGWVRPWTASAAVGREAVMVRDDVALNRARAECDLARTVGGAGPPDERVPALSVRAHRHKFADSGLHHVPRVVVLPSWQFSTAYGRKVSPSNLPDVGGLFIVVDGEGYRLIPRLYTILRDIDGGAAHVKIA